MKQYYFFGIFLTISILTFGQTVKKKNIFPIWTFHHKNVNIDGLSIGIASVRSEPRHTNTNGIKIELIGFGFFFPIAPQIPVAQNDSEYLVLTKEPISEVINGVALSASGTICDCITNGVSAGLIGQYNFQINGISGALFGNFAQNFNGLHLAIMFNQAYYLNGIQVGLLNSAENTKGIQIGGGNFGKNTSGLQIGLFNKTENLHGIQIGIWNKNQKRQLPLINWNFKHQEE